MSSVSPPDTLKRRVRGITKGKNTERIVKHTGKRVCVRVDKQFNAFVGTNASKLATSLGFQLRKKAPVEGINKWSEIDPIIKDSIVQEALDSFNIKGYGVNKRVTEIINTKCQNLYRGWKCRAKRYYEGLLAKGKDPYYHCFPSMEDTKWKYMMEHVWNSENFKKRSQINKQNRDNVSYTYTMGPKSFASVLYDISIKAKKDKAPPKFSKFLKLSHHSEEKDGWIDQHCEEDHVMLDQLENVSVLTGDLISPDELSQSVLRKKKSLKGLGVSMKASSKKNIVKLSNSHDNNELLVLNGDDETVRRTNQEYVKKIDSQEVMIKSQKDTIETLKKEIEDMKVRQMRFMNLVLASL